MKSSAKRTLAAILGALVIGSTMTAVAGTSALAAETAVVATSTAFEKLAPKGLTANGDIDHVILQWKSVGKEAEGYQVYRATSKNGKYTKLCNTEATALRDSSAKPGKTYYYKVRAYTAKKDGKRTYSKFSTVSCNFKSDAALQQAYANKVSRYLKIFNAVQKDGDDAKLPSSGFNQEFVNGCKSIENGVPAFLLKDINNDGTLELFIGIAEKNNKKSFTIYDVFTFQNGKAIRLMSNIGYRAGTCILCENGVIKDYGSSSASEGFVKMHKLPKNGTKLKTVAMVSRMNGKYYVHSTTTTSTTKISKKDYDKIVNNYKEITVKASTITSSVVKKLQNGTYYFTTSQNA